MRDILFPRLLSLFGSQNDTGFSLITAKLPSQLKRRSKLIYFKITMLALDYVYALTDISFFLRDT